MKQIEKVLCLTVGTTAQTVEIGGLAFLMENLSDSAGVYFKERRDDGEAAASGTGYCLGPGESLPLALTAVELSVVASAADTDVRLLLLSEL